MLQRNKARVLIVRHARFNDYDENSNLSIRPVLH